MTLYNIISSIISVVDYNWVPMQMCIRLPDRQSLTTRGMSHVPLPYSFDQQAASQKASDQRVNLGC